MTQISSSKLTSDRYKSFIAAYTESPVRDGNDVRILTNGNEIFPSMLQAIADANHSILFVTYVYWRGPIASTFADALSKKARSGIAVSVLIDAFGSSKIDSNLITAMQDAGVEVRWFRPFRWYTLHKYNNRTHRKILVIDTAIGFVGGVGIAQEWTGDAEDRKHWRDTHFRVTGPSVFDMIQSFNDNWEEAGGAPITANVTLMKSSGSVSAQITSSRSSTGQTRGEKLFTSIIRSAEHTINITTAYFAPNKAFRDLLIAASKRGVTVTILTNGPYTNHMLVRKAGHKHYHELLQAGIIIYEYHQTLIHAKVATIDGSWATVGSINFDDRSFILNDEISLSFTDTTLVAALDEQLTRDIAVSKRITLKKWSTRSIISRMSELIAHAFRPQL